MKTHVINSHLVCPEYDREYPMLEYGKGVYLFDRDGKPYIDASGCTAAVTHIGHGVEEIADAMANQARKLTLLPTHLFYNETLESYLTKLCHFAPEGFVRAWTICGGTEAVENSIKLAFQYHKAKGRTNRNKVLSRWLSYHGNSILALDVGGMKVRRDYYAELMFNHLHLSACYPYRRDPSLSIEEYEDTLIDEFQQAVDQHSENIICFLAEPIAGAGAGALEPTPHYFDRIAAICEENDILMISDEVMTGLGRTGKNFGCQHYGTHADILACAKGISGGYLPLGAILAHERVLAPLRERNVPFFSGQTYACTPLAGAVGEAVLEYIQKHRLVENAAKIGAALKEKLESLKELPWVGDVRGEGLLLGIEYVLDQTTKEVIPPEKMFAKTVERIAFSEGLITYIGRGNVEGTKGDYMLFAPPLTINIKEAEELTTILKQSIIKAAESVGL